MKLASGNFVSSVNVIFSSSFFYVASVEAFLFFLGKLQLGCWSPTRTRMSQCFALSFKKKREKKEGYRRENIKIYVNLIESLHAASLTEVQQHFPDLAQHSF